MSNKIRMNIALWTYKDFIEFTRAFNQGNNDVTFDKAMHLIVSWDYSTPLEAPEAIYELGVTESAEVIKTVWQVLNDFAEAIDVSKAVVDFSRWNTRKFFEFDGYRRDGNITKAEKMVHEIVKMEGVSPDRPLSFEEGAIMFKAVTEAYRKIVTGKN